jgi:hypothetical protein
MMRFVSSNSGSFDMPDDFLEKWKNQLSLEEADLCLHLGFFIQWYSAVEVWITFLLARVLDQRDPENFELLTAGMDAKIKCERLRTGCRINDFTLGVNLDDRLTYFQERIVPVRNKISHNWATVPEGSKLIHFTTFSRVPGQKRQFRAGGPTTVALQIIFDHGLWLDHFSEDISTLTGQEPLPKLLEIANPQTSLPTEFLERRQRLRERANADMQPPTEV